MTNHVHLLVAAYTEEGIGKIKPFNQHKAYRQLFPSYLTETDLRDIREKINKGWVLGSEEFKRKIYQFTRHPYSFTVTLI
ncbi:MAG: hypothetical protein GY806_01760 [Gammaproteobacteria bacterium]|nr:hypothetical protein [Gammaproteobacteria bacterium]